MAELEQLTARGPRTDIESASEAIGADVALEQAAHSLIEEDEARGLWRLDAWPTTAAEGDAIWRLLTLHKALKLSRRRLAEADWVALALSGLPPVRAGRFFVYGAHDRGRVPGGVKALRIEAGAAFGTGHHATTVGCLLALDRVLKRRRPRRVLDVGTGTGVLAIAAAKSGAKRVVATDIDPVAVRIAADNGRLNRARLTSLCTDGLADPKVSSGGPYDLVLANILARPLIALAGDIALATRPGGLVILSGLLRSQARAVRSAYVGRGFGLAHRIDIETWTTLAMRRRGHLLADERLRA